MATAPQTVLTLEEFDQRYGSEPGWEYWFGEAVRKPVPTWYHGVLQVVLANLLFEAGYFAGGEIDLKVDPRWQPRPDVLAASAIDGRYPTKPVDLVIEILSDDQFRYLHDKCRHYKRIGIQRIYVADPDERRLWQWNPERDSLDPSETIILPNGTALAGSLIWTEFEKRISRA
jgi:Uma2 family endonuclease